MRSHRRVACASVVLAVLVAPSAIVRADPTITGTFYTHTQTTPNDPFSIRGVAVGQGGAAGDVYYSHIKPAADSGPWTAGDTQIVQLGSTGSVLGWTDLPGNVQSKALTTDDLGNVYAAFNSPSGTGVYLYNSALSSASKETFAVPGASEINGVAVAKGAGGHYNLYVSNRAYSVSDTSFVRSYSIVPFTDPSTWTLNWQATISGSHSLRDMALDASGNAWVTDHDNGLIYKISANGGTVTASNPATLPMVGPVGIVVATPNTTPFVFAVGENDSNSAIYEIDPTTMALKASYSLTQLPAGSNYGLGGIAYAGSDRFYLSNEDGLIDGTGHYVDYIYTASAPEPASLALLVCGGLTLLRRRRGV